MNILVVHDERAVADLIANFLCGHGHHALPLYDRIEALDHLGRIKFELALVGVSIPDLAGLRLADRLCDMNNPLGQWIQVVLMATEDTIEVLRSRRIDFEYLPLPIDVEELLAKIRGIETRSAIELQQALEFLKEYGSSSPDQ
jgi:DNA-binding response OmpR family regulator